MGFVPRLKKLYSARLETNQDQVEVALELKLCLIQFKSSSICARGRSRLEVEGNASSD